jgi:hypothetical protein
VHPAVNAGSGSDAPFSSLRILPCLLGAHPITVASASLYILPQSTLQWVTWNRCAELHLGGGFFRKRNNADRRSA